MSAPWQRLTVLGLIVVTVGGSIYLFFASGHRRLLIAAAGSEFRRLYLSDEAKGIFRLPAPPPKSVEAKVVVQSPMIITGDEGGTIYSMDATAAQGEAEVDKTYIPPAKTPEAEAAFTVLKSKSEVAGKLVSGELADFDFKEWNPVQAKSPLYWIELKATNPAGQEIRLTWSVDIESLDVKPLSQAARDLEAGTRDERR